LSISCILVVVPDVACIGMADIWRDLLRAFYQKFAQSVIQARQTFDERPVCTTTTVCARPNHKHKQR
jgi:hypothetical protein